MDWYKQMIKELNRVKSKATMTKVPSNRKPSAISQVRLEKCIESQIRENNTGGRAWID